MHFFRTMSKLWKLLQKLEFWGFHQGTKDIEQSETIVCILKYEGRSLQNGSQLFRYSWHSLFTLLIH